MDPMFPLGGESAEESSEDEENGERVTVLVVQKKQQLDGCGQLKEGHHPIPGAEGSSRGLPEPREAPMRGGCKYHLGPESKAKQA